MFDYTKKVLSSYFGKAPSEEFRRKCQDLPRDYSDLPKLFRFFDGREVKTVEDFELHRKEILDYYAKEVYSPIPNLPCELFFRTLETGEYNGMIREQVELKAKNEHGENVATILIYRPKVDNPVPLIIGQNFDGNFAITPDESVIVTESSLSEKAVAKKRGKSKQFDVRQIVGRNVALMTCHYKDFAEDNKKRYKDRLGKLFLGQNDLSALSILALGYRFMVDYALSRKEFDKNKIALFGHSRIGKTALWASANDPRVALTILNDSGCMGANLCLGSTGETIKMITKTFPHWFSKNIEKYAREASRLSVDQHMLLAAIAPRKLYVANGYSDLCADPQGSYNSLQFALPAFELFGLKTIPKTFLQPPVDTCEFSESVAYHIRRGSHDVLPEDWNFYLDYIEKYL